MVFRVRIVGFVHRDGEQPLTIDVMASAQRSSTAIAKAIDSLVDKILEQKEPEGREPCIVADVALEVIRWDG